MRIRQLTAPPAPTFEFSICTLVTDMQEYGAMHASFVRNGFDEKRCEYIIADNSKGNVFDAYEACNAFIHQAQAPFVIICHQDVVLLEDGIEKLRSCIRKLDEDRPTWAVAGNAGARRIKEYFFKITENDGRERDTGPYPAQVHSLDENFLIIRKEANLGLSRDLDGFHFYGTEICLQAEMLGWKCHVIDFHLRHNSGGTLNPAFYEQKKKLIAKYRHAWRPRYIQTTCTRLFVSGNRLLNWFLNLRFPMFLAKEYYKRLG